MINIYESFVNYFKAFKTMEKYIEVLVLQPLSISTWCLYQTAEEPYFPYIVLKKGIGPCGNLRRQVRGK
jgi:hypothetical protein